MGYSKAQKKKTHERIVKLASKRFREEGLARIGIAELMKEAGLTVGGFYKHFNSRDHLVAEAVNSAFGGWKRRVEAAKPGGPPVSYEKLIDDYLNEAHRDNPGTGCAFSALAPEIARSDKRTRALYLRTGPERYSVMVLGPSGSDCAGRRTHDRRCFPRPGAVPMGPTGPIDRVLQDSRDGVVVFGRYDQKSIGAANALLQFQH
jgi:TetR/AcrR family transcriptional repressor of nem operon